jgi:WhiB family redox-sensing transcriptional regulator
MSQSIQTIQTISQDPPRVSAASPAAATPAGFQGDEPAEDWQNFANCLGVDPDLFFPERGASTKEAKGVCQACVVREDCLEYALENSEKFGIWGGLSERERRRLRRARALARAAAAETRTA